MTHLEIENLASDYLEGLLEPSQCADVEAHVAGCSSCRELLADVRHALELCQSTEAPEPRPWLVSRIMLATVGEQKPTWRERLAAYLAPVRHPRVVYPIAMTVFTFSIIVNAAGLNLRHLRLEDLNPRTWIDRADRQGHMLYAHAEKFYYDLRVVYEIESRFRQFSDNSAVPQQEPPKQEAPSGGSSQRLPSYLAMGASKLGWVVVSNRQEAITPNRVSDPGRSPLP